MDCLPYLITDTLIGMIPAAADRRSLCLTSHSLRSYALPRLYRNITLRTCELSETLPISLHAQNIGLAHTRSLIVQDHFEREYNHETHGAVLFQILQNMPLDSLRWFALDTISCVPPEMMLLVRSTQRNLENFQLHHSCSLFSISKVPAREELNLVTSFQFILQTEEDARVGRRILQSARDVLSLDIRIARDADIFDYWNNRRCFTFLKALFSDYCQHLDSNYKMRPSKLHLKQLNLGQAGDILLEALDFGSMTELIMDHCIDCKDFLEALSQRDHILKTFSDQKRLEFCGGWDRSERIVSSACGLVHLTLSSVFGPCSSLPTSLLLISQHGPTLVSLVLDDFGYTLCTPGDPDRSLSAFRRLSLHCPRLEFLAIPMPILGCEGLHEHENLIGCLSNLRALVAIRLTTQFQYRGIGLPRCREGCVEGIEWQVFMHAQAQKFANKLFRRLEYDCPNLVAVIVDVRKFGEDCSDRGPPQYAYGRQTVKDPQGQTFTFGVQEEPGIIKTRLPRWSDVLI